MKPSDNCIDMIKGFEGYSSVAYQDSGGVWTIGYGTTTEVKRGDTVTREIADHLLRHDVRRFSEFVDQLIHVPLNQNQYDALVSFVYNLGPTNLKISTLRILLNNNDYAGAADQFLRWNKDDRNVLRGLTLRREAERKLFLS